MWPQCEFHFSVGKIIKENPNMDMLITIAYPHSIHSGAARAKNSIQKFSQRPGFAIAETRLCSIRLSKHQNS